MTGSSTPGAAPALAVSVVSIAEIGGGMRSGERLEVTRLLGSFQPMPIDASVAWRTGEFRREYRRSHASIGPTT